MSLLICEEEAELERQYSPSMWSTRFSREEVLRNHVETVEAGSKRALEEVPHILEVDYGASARQKFDIFGMDLPDRSPMLVFVHGGYWQELSREQSRYPAAALHRAGVRTVMVGYDLAPEVSLPEIVGQIRDALKLVLQFAERYKSRGVYLAGHSAGAHLIAKALSCASLMRNSTGCQRLQGAFFISGVFDLRELVRTSLNHALQLDEQTAISMSPMFDDFTHLRDKRMRMYVLVGENDSPTFKKQSRAFYHRLLEVSATNNMYLEVKDRLDHFEIVEVLANDDNYLRKLLAHDIANRMIIRDS